MQITNETIRKIAKKYENMFSFVAEFGAKRIQSYVINCTDLDERYFTQDIRNAEKFQPMFNELQKIQNPCVYCFEIQSDISAETIIDGINASGKNIPAIKNEVSKDSKILYVGRSNCVWGRLIAHLGFHTNKNSGNPIPSSIHGLYLFDWAKGLNLKLKFHVFEFEEDMKDLVEVLERKFADMLNPIIGKHR